jgi:ABC-type multidrug transport system ATPase subunit
MGITPQDAGVFESLTVWEHLVVFARVKGLKRNAAADETREIANDLGLGGALQKRVGALSGGQRRRVLIGLALLGRPPLLVLDEPTTGLDPVSRQAVWRLLRQVVHDGVTLLLTTHSIEEAERLSDRIGIITAGRMVALGTVAELAGRLPEGEPSSLEHIYADAI